MRKIFYPLLPMLLVSNVGLGASLLGAHTHDNHVCINGQAGVVVSLFKLDARGIKITSGQPYAGTHSSRNAKGLDIDVIAGRRQSEPVATEFYDAVSAYTSMYGHESMANFDVWGTLTVNGHEIQGVHIMQGSFGEPGNPWIIGQVNAGSDSGDIIVSDDNGHRYRIHQSTYKEFSVSAE